MSLALIALLSLVAILVVAGFRNDLNAGILAIAVAYALGMTAAGLSASEIAALLPSQLILTIVGVAMLFELANQNGTLEQITHFSIRLVHGHHRLLPLSFFVLSFMLSALGPGNIAATALIAPVAMQTAVSAGVRPVLMAVLVCTGANAGAFSPVSLTGIINTALIQNIGLTASILPLKIFLMLALIQTLSALAAYVLFGGYRLADTTHVLHTRASPLNKNHIFTLVALGFFIVSIVIFKLPASVGAFTLVSLLTLFRVSNIEDSLKHLPWGVVILISGIGLLIELLQMMGSLELTTTLLAQYASPSYINALIAFVTGLASLGSSSSGVVMPLFIPLAPDILQKVGGGDLTNAVIAIDLGSHMADVSPLSTLGALCLAALPETVNRSRLFRQLLTWGVSMTFVAALLAFWFLDFF
jgi:Na+/H+ antiporter NhaD/arsenite permease-like protein